MSTVRTRFAPSPTGYLHIGGARTALFNYLYARQNAGTFVLRIEDTDRERSRAEYLDDIRESLRWLGLAWDEGPFFQSQRTALYRETLERMLQAGTAYRCFCSAEEVEAKRQAALREGRHPVYDGTCRDRPPGPADAGRPFVVRFRAPRSGETVVEDIVKGRVVFQNTELDDLVIARSDGSPTYNFCVVVDDAAMGITHIIRGDDHLPNTPRQLLLYQALGERPPRFAHVPLILGSDRVRLSKRHGATSVSAYRAAGYLPEALVNYLARLGWSHGDQEIFSRAELIEKFRLEEVGKSAGIFNPEKLLWLNAHHLRQCSPADLAAAVAPFIAARGHAVPGDSGWLAKMVSTLQERAKTLTELVEMAEFYLSDEITIDPRAAASHLRSAIAPALSDLRDLLATLKPWNEESLREAFASVLTRHGLKLGRLAQPVRVAVTGGTASPGIYEVLAVLGRERTVRRLDRGLALARSTV